MDSFQKATGDLDMEKTKALNDLFASVFASKSTSHTAPVAESKCGKRENEELPMVGDQV